jgi:mannose-1-phosphate guanylyltransferase/mannose-6-phosphate isomerase
VVVLAGGAGERFWPRSRRHRPKPFLEVVDGKSLLATTLDRARRIAAPDHVWIVCGREHAAALRRHAGLPASRVLVEPMRRNTAMAAAWAAVRLAAVDPDAVVVTLAADHRIPDPAAFARACLRAARAADGAGALVTLGIEPTRPETGYGYIQVGKPAGSPFPGLHRVRRFVEKPDVSRAQKFLRQGGFLWNAGIFIWTARALLEEIEACAPQLAQAIAPLRVARRGGPSARAVAAAYRAAPAAPIDVAVLEKSRRVWTLPVSFRWSDVGTWASLAEELGLRSVTNVTLGKPALFEESAGNLVWSDRRLIALFGVDGLVVVDTADALLVAKLERSGDLRRLIEKLRAQGREDLT